MPALVETMFSYREVPWHGLGEITDHVLTAAEAIEAAGLDWAVETFPVIVNGREQARWQATVRMDCGDVLGIVGDRYCPVQNRDLFVFFDQVVSREEGAFYHTGGSLQGGRRVWLLAKVPGDFYVPGVPDDFVENFILLASSHDGSLAVVAKHTPVRVVCNNTLAMALRDRATRSVSIKHMRNAVEQLREASRLLGLAQARSEALMDVAARMVRKQMNSALVVDLFKYVFPSANEVDGNPPSAKVQAHRERVYELFEGGEANSLPGMRGSAWAMYNAVAEYADHEYPTRTATDTLNRIWFGQAELLKTKAAKVLLGQVAPSKLG